MEDNPMCKCGLVLLFVLFFSLQATAETMSIEAGRDNTLIEDPAGAYSNGSGPNFFVGRTNQPEGSNIRRGVIYFDLTAVPGKAAIESVSLTLYQDANNPDQRLIGLHRLIDDWGEGASSSSGGQGALSQPGDATWLHTLYPGNFWSHEGGNFTGESSAWQFVGGLGYYTWENADGLVKDVQFWLKKPQKNFGWTLIGDEDNPQTVKRFASRENLNTAFRPVLTVIYRLPL
jgi:hypothetical protein